MRWRAAARCLPVRVLEKRAAARLVPAGGVDAHACRWRHGRRTRRRRGAVAAHRHHAEHRVVHWRIQADSHCHTRVHWAHGVERVRLLHVLRLLQHVHRRVGPHARIQAHAATATPAVPAALVRGTPDTTRSPEISAVARVRLAAGRIAAR